MIDQLVALAGMILIAALAFCLFDAGGAADGDPCGASLVPSVGLVMPFLVTLAGRVLPEADETYFLCASDLPAPPPRA
jgi:hypothetical protein